jgi:hypothetical protein
MNLNFSVGRKMKNVLLKFEVVRYLESGQRFYITPSVLGQFRIPKFLAQLLVCTLPQNVPILHVIALWSP